jgi:hypothetical protein
VIESKAHLVALTFEANTYSGLHLEKGDLDVTAGSCVQNGKGTI